MTEKELQQAVVELCSWLHYPLFHAYDSRRSNGPGYPDLTIAVPGRVLFRELKTENGKLTAVQHQWQAALRLAGADVGVWRPSDWVTGQIRAELMRPARNLEGCS